MDKRAFFHIGPNILAFIAPLWRSVYSQLNSLGSMPPSVSLLHISTLLDRCVLLLLCNSFPYLHEVEAAGLLTDLTNKTQVLFESLNAALAAKTLDEDDDVTVKMRKSIRKLLKYTLTVQGKHPLGFYSCLSGMVGLCHHILLQSLVPEFRVQSLSFINAVLSSPAYRSNVNGYQQKPSEAATHAQQQFSSFFTADRVKHLFEYLCTNGLPLTDEELDTWRANPESLVDEDEDGVGALDEAIDLRVVAEQSVVQLSAHFSDVCLPILSFLFQQCNTNAQQVDFRDPAHKSQMLLQDAMLQALGLCAEMLSSHIPADSIVSLLSQLVGSHVVLQRRTAVVLMKWIEYTPEPLYLTILQILTALISVDDLIVRVSVIQALRKFFFKVENPELFYQLQESIFPLLFDMLTKISSSTIQWQIVNMSLLLIEKADFKFSSTVSNCLHMLVTVWHNADKRSTNGNLDREELGEMLKTAVLDLLKSLTFALVSSAEAKVGDNQLVNRFTMLDVDQFNGFVAVALPLVDFALTSSSVIMMESGLQQWLLLLRYAPNMTPAWDAFLQKHIGIMASDNVDNLASTFDILEEYVLLGGPDLIYKHAQPIVWYLESLLKPSTDADGQVTQGQDRVVRGQRTLVRILDHCCRSMPAAWVFTNLQNAIRQLVMMFLNGQAKAIGHTNTMRCFARLILSDMSSFFNLLSSSQINTELFLNHWVNLFDDVAGAYDQKIVALSFISMLRVLFPVLQTSLSDVLRLCCNVIIREIDAVDDPRKKAMRNLFDSLKRAAKLTIPDSERRTMAYNSDPLRQVDIVNSLANCLQEVANSQSISVQHLLSAIDPTLQQQVIQLLSRGAAQ
eukprot:GILK01012647.1.p1 GENE.GILK01012647.1~~GILK01012647.1.p1  ORF type:complete len:985 (+),score=179.43 GILK01012647.1:415-2955(+)